MAYFDIQPFASTNPAVGQLFAAEFAQRQAQRQADAQTAANEVARQQIQAQSQLAQSQQRQAMSQQEYNNLFREREFQAREKGEQERNALLEKQLGIDKAYKEGLTKKPEARSTKDIDEANAASEALASQYNAAYQTRLATRKAAIEVQRKAALDKVWFLGGGNKDEINARHDQMVKDADEQEFQNVIDIATKYAPPGTIGVDPLTKQFRAVKLSGGSDTGAGPYKAPPGTPNDYDYMGNPVDNAGAAAALGTTPTAAAPKATPNPAALGQVPSFADQMTKWAPSVPANPASWADMFKQTPATVTASPSAVTQTIQVPIDEAHFLEMPAADAAEAERQLRAVPVEQRPAVAAAIRDNLMKSGRATLRVRIAPMHEVLRNLPLN